MSFWEKEIELMDRSQLENLQLNRLRLTLARAQKAPYYNRIFQEKGLDPDSIKSLADLADWPFTTKEDLRSGRPEDFLAVPQERVVRLHASSGTTGAPTAIYHTKSDLNGWADQVARCLCMVGVTPADVFQNMIGYGLFTGGLGLHYGAELLGATVIPAGTGNSRRQVNLMKQFKTTVIHIIPSYALKLVDKMAEFGVEPKRDLNLRVAVIGAEPHSEGARRRIEEAYGVMAANSYGLSEMNGPGVAFECPHQTGLHLWEDHYILEIVDPRTFESLPPGEVGEVVLTTLCREAMPLIRYRTRDLAMIMPEPCPCGRTHRRLSRIQGRTDDMIILKGVNIFPMQIERVLMDLPEAGSNYLIILDKDGPLDEMAIQVEMGPALLDREPDQIRRAAAKITRYLKDEILINPHVELVEPGILPSGDGKAVRVLDRRGSAAD